jgi:hypothetical protein
MGRKHHQHEQASTPTRETNNTNVRKTQPMDKSNAKKNMKRTKQENEP